MTPDVQAHADNGVTRLVFGPAATDVREQIPDFASRHKLG